jgi:hypothetical protein
LQCQLEPRQCDGFNQLQVETKDCSKMDHWS